MKYPTFYATPGAGESTAGKWYRIDNEYSLTEITLDKGRHGFEMSVNVRLYNRGQVERLKSFLVPIRGEVFTEVVKRLSNCFIKEFFTQAKYK